MNISRQLPCGAGRGIRLDHLFGAVILGSGLLCSGFAGAQDNWPSRPVTLVYPLSPGSAADIEVRRYTKLLQEGLGQSFVVDFKPGGNGIIANNFVAKARPDGYTYLLPTSNFAMIPVTTKSLPYDTLKDFAPVSLLTKRAMLLVASSSFKPNNFPEYVAYAKANPGKVNWGITAEGGPPHLTGAWFHNATKTQVTFVPFKGAAGYTTEMLAGRVDVGLLGLSSARRHIEAGKLKLLFIATLRRVKAFPLVPTAAESGIPGFEYPSWLGLIAPAGVPVEIVNRFSSETKRVVHSPEIAEALDADAIEPVGSTPAEFAKIIAADIVRTRKLAQDNNITFSD